MLPTKIATARILPTETTKPRTDHRLVSALIFGPPKIGKSTFCSMADGALFLATEAGLNHVEAFQMPVPSWPVLLEAAKEIAEGQHRFKTIVIDTIDQAFRLCSEHVLRKHDIEHESDLGYGKGYAFVQNEFLRVIRKLALLPYGLWFVSHAVEKEIETRTGKVNRVVPTLPDKVRKDVVALVDLILYADIERSPDGEFRRVLRTKPTQFYEAGDRTGRLPDTLPLDYAAFATAFDKPNAKGGK